MVVSSPFTTIVQTNLKYWCHKYSVLDDSNARLHNFEADDVTSILGSDLTPASRHNPTTF